MITVVTAFLCGDAPKHTYEVYLSQFQRLADTGVPIVLFLDDRTGWSSFPENVKVYHTRLADTWVGQTIPDDVHLPALRNPSDTREYMMIQNTKPEFVFRASQINPWKTEWFAWIDFGIGHVFKDPDTTFERIRTMVPPNVPCLRTAGIWSPSIRGGLDAIWWRFAGGFFLAHASKLPELHDTVKRVIQTNLPKFAWEVNIWGLVEREGVDFGWFLSDHNDTIIPADTA